MEPPQLGAGSFEFYEGIRIVIPGAAIVTMYAAIIAMFHLSAPSPASDALAAISATVGAGLILYFVDAPAKARAFTADEQPHTHLEALGVRRPAAMSTLNFYFVVLDEFVPSPIRARALYMGSMYRIGFELIYICFVSSVAVLSVCLLGVDQPVRNAEKSYLVFGIGAILSLLLVPTAVYLGHRRLRRRKPATRVWTQVRQQVPGIDRGLLLFAAACFAWYCICGGHPRAFFALGVAVPSVLWAVRYFRGTRASAPTTSWSHPIRRSKEYLHPNNRGGKRVPLEQPAAVGYYSIASLAPFIAEYVVRPSLSPLSPGIATAWVAVNLIGGVLVVARGHERRLGGSYATQRAWLDLRGGMLREQYGDTRVRPPNQP
jgi:hypothetical protein